MRIKAHTTFIRVKRSRKFTRVTAALASLLRMAMIWKMSALTLRRVLRPSW
jgi:hypothetical protein